MMRTRSIAVMLCVVAGGSIAALLFFGKQRPEAVAIRGALRVAQTVGTPAPAAKIAREPISPNARIRGDDRNDAAGHVRKTAIIAAGLRAYKTGATVRLSEMLRPFLKELGFSEDVIDKAISLSMDAASARSREELQTYDNELRQLLGDDEFEDMRKWEDLHYKDNRAANLLADLQRTNTAISDADVAKIKSSLDAMVSDRALFVASDLRFQVLTRESVGQLRTASANAFDSAFRNSEFSPSVYAVLRAAYLEKSVGPWEKLLQQKLAKRK